MKRVLCFLLLACFLVPGLSSCEPKSAYISDTFFCMDTLAEIRLYGDAPDVFSDCRALAAAIEGQISCTLPDADVTRLDTMDSGTLQVGAYTQELWRISVEISERTNGYFSPALGRVIDLWKNAGSMPTQQELDHAREGSLSDFALAPSGEMTRIGTVALIDFGAVGKGYCADKLTEMMKNEGVETAMISFVSSMVVFGEKTYRIGLRSADGVGIAGYISLENAALSVSGDYERFFEVDGEKLPHIIDPETGRPAQSGLHSVAVVTDSGAEADALSTALFAMGPGKAVDYYLSSDRSFDMILMTDEAVIVSDGLWDEFSASSPDDSKKLLKPEQYPVG